MSAHLIVCAVDCHTHSPHLTMANFGRRLTRSLAYVAPVCPLLLVSGSAMLLVGSRLLRIPLELAHGVIEWGSMCVIPSPYITHLSAYHTVLHDVKG